MFLDATYCHSRIGGDAHGKGGRVASRAVVIATGVRADGHREVLGSDVGDSEDEVFWTDFLRSLRERGLSGVQLVISDAHTGLKKAIKRVLSGASWQRCRVHFMRNALARVPKGQAEMGRGRHPHHLRPARHRPRARPGRRPSLPACRLNCHRSLPCCATPART